MTRRVVKIDVTDYFKLVAKGAGLAWSDDDRVVLPVKMWKKMVKVLRLDDYIPEETDQDKADNAS